MRHLIPLVTAVALVGCYGSTITGDAQTDPGEDSTHDTLADTSVDPTVDTSHDTEADTAYDAPPDVECTPSEEVTTSFTIDGFPEYTDIDVVLVCDALDWWEDPAEGEWGIVLACHSDEGLVEEHVLTLSSFPYLVYPYPPSSDLVLRYVNQAGWPGSRWFTLSADDSWLVVAGTQAWTSTPPGRSMEEWYAPLGFAVVTEICPVEETDCGPFERMGIEVELHEDRQVILDGRRGQVGWLMGPTADVNVQDAWQYHELLCDGAPSTWYQLALVVPPSM